ncbi:hypothetical protein T265_08780 [Opisthorchis viverrini]|uniref:Uncharacterized protein n=1 Tax=Opisthorchis viverrini TaxID=6198 RepID=A0A075A776_OPIVI|nr:hypothetical protein T265_08780 [Opisthorchis viverrini]KER23294.1 hypothetical protein T265_08780 [Opisthorchis viverrini]
MEQVSAPSLHPAAEIVQTFAHPVERLQLSADISAQFPQTCAPGCGTSAEMEQVSAPSLHPAAEIVQTFAHPGKTIASELWSHIRINRTTLESALDSKSLGSVYSPARNQIESQNLDNTGHQQTDPLVYLRRE